MEKYLLVQVDHRAQMLTPPCDIEVRHLTLMTKVSGLIFNKTQGRLFLFAFLVFLFFKILVSCDSVKVSTLSLVCSYVSSPS
jgi:hypothetical protein